VILMKKLTILLGLALFVALLVPGAAFANFAIHGNYVSDTDACAGCHRAHTSVSTLTWQDSASPANDHTALLVSTAAKMYQFCYACHDAVGQGADTNVQEGIYEGSVYGTKDAILNGGGFESLGASGTTSSHIIEGGWGAYGGGYAGTGSTFSAGYLNAGQGAGTGDPGVGVGNQIKMDCTTCHDPHGSANYRILKDKVNANAVGGYVANVNAPNFPTPDGWVSSVETGWPVGGFQLHTPYPTYIPNYTRPLYAKGYDLTVTDGGAGNKDVVTAGAVNDKGMSGWCDGCHSTYLQDIATFSRTNPDSSVTTYASSASTYNAGDGVFGGGLTRRHRHPINVALSTYNAADKASMIITASVLPVAHDIANQPSTVTTTQTDWIECLTCHRAHGTSAIMTGYAADPAAFDLPDFPSGTPSALLRRDNRGVCEACHNK
jgi:hypothetical protein